MIQTDNIYFYLHYRSSAGLEWVPNRSDPDRRRVMWRVALGIPLRALFPLRAVSRSEEALGSISHPRTHPDDDDDDDDDLLHDFLMYSKWL